MNPIEINCRRQTQGCIPHRPPVGKHVALAGIVVVARHLGQSEFREQAAPNRPMERFQRE